MTRKKAPAEDSMPTGYRSRGEAVCAFIEEYCRAPEGVHVGKPIVLDAFQKEFILSVYDNEVPTLRAILSIARKNGKTALIAGILLAHICGPEARLNTQIVSGALSREQAAIVFNLAAKMIRLEPRLAAVTRILPSAKSILGLRKNVEYKALSAEGKTAHGLSPILVLLDEVGQVRGPHSDFIDALLTAQGAHEHPLVITISTQAPNDADLLSIWIDDAKSSGDPSIVCRVYEAPRGCALDDEEAWAAANPAVGKFRSLADLRDQATRAARMPSSEPAFRNLCLNQRVEMVSPFISRGVWVLNSEEPDESVFYEEPVYGALDLSGKIDLTCLILMAFREKWHVKCIFWTPEKGVRERSKRDRAPYDVWAEEGLIRLVPGAAIDYEYIARDLGEITDGMNITALAFDRWRFDLLKKEIDEIGLELPLNPFGQGFKDMAPALDRLEELLLNEQLAHGAHPVLTMCMANARVERDAAGNRKLNKAKATGRIDGAVGLAMAVGCISAEENSGENSQTFIDLNRLS
jgi:phage terminase large subunit-like protein